MMTRSWEKLSEFLHTANLMPLVVLVSSYHYYQALSSHDPLLVALPMALFVDLLHFRTVQRAVQTGEWPWRLTALLTTGLAFGLQWMFYSQPGARGTLSGWQALLFAGIVPLGLAIMAWHHQRQSSQRMWLAELAEMTERATLWQIRAEAEQRRADEMQGRAAEEQARANEMQTRAEAEQQRAAEMQARAAEMQRQAAAEQARANEMQGRAEQEQGRAAEMQAEAEAERQWAERLQTEAKTMQQQLEQMLPAYQAWQALNQETQTLALVNAKLLTPKAAAAQLAIHETTVRRKAKRLNGTATTTTEGV